MCGKLYQHTRVVLYIKQILQAGRGGATGLDVLSPVVLEDKPEADDVLVRTVLEIGNSQSIVIRNHVLEVMVS